MKIVLCGIGTQEMWGPGTQAHPPDHTLTPHPHAQARCTGTPSTRAHCMSAHAISPADAIGGWRPRTARTASFKYPGLYATLHNMAPGLGTE